MAVNKNNWQSKMLVELCDFLSRGKSPKYADDIPSYPVFAQKCNLKEGGISLDNVRFLDPETVYKWQDNYKLQDKDIVINSTGNGTVGRVGLFRANILGQYPFIVPDSHVTVARMKDYCDSAFFYYCLKSQKIQKYFEDNLQGSTNQTELYIKTVKETFVLVPPLSEQQAIAEELDGIQSMIGKCREQLEDYDRLARSIFHEMFGDPVKNDKGWDKQKLGDLFETSSGGTPSKKVPEYWENGNVPWIGSNMCQNCVISENDGKYITELGLAKSSAKLLPPGSILIAMVGATIGKVALLNFECATNQNIASVNVNSNNQFTPLFVFYAIMGIYSIFLNIGEGKFTIASLSFIRDLSIITPPLPLQQQFATRIEAIEAMKETTKAQLADLQQLFDSRMQYYFS